MLTVITGGTRGIGAATAHRLARDGHDLVLGYASDDDAAESTARAVREHGPDVNLVRADLTTDAGVDLLFGRAAELGTVTGLVNNAGATLSIGPLAEASTDVVRRTVDLNLTAAILCARAAVRLMSASREVRAASSSTSPRAPRLSEPRTSTSSTPRRRPAWTL